MFKWFKRRKEQVAKMPLFGYLGDRAHYLHANSPIDLPVIRTATFADGLPEPLSITFYDAGLGRAERGAHPDEHIVIVVVGGIQGDWLRTPLSLRMPDEVAVDDRTFRGYVAELLEPTGQLIHTFSQEPSSIGMLRDGECRLALARHVVAATPGADEP